MQLGLDLAAATASDPAIAEKLPTRCCGARVTQGRGYVGDSIQPYTNCETCDRHAQAGKRSPRVRVEAAMDESPKYVALPSFVPGSITIVPTRDDGHPCARGCGYTFELLLDNTNYESRRIMRMPVHLCARLVSAPAGVSSAPPAVARVLRIALARFVTEDMTIELSQAKIEDLVSPTT